MNSSEAASAPAQPPRSTSTLSVTPEAASSQGLLRACSPREQPPGSQCAHRHTLRMHVKIQAALGLMHLQVRASQVVPEVKNLAVNAGDPGLILGSGRSPGGGKDNPLQYSHLGKPMDRGRP